MNALQSTRPIENRKGASIILIIFMFIVMMIFAFFSLNIANIQRNLVASQIASDLASRWGVDELSRSTDTERIEEQVRDLAHRNWTLTDNQAGWLQANIENIDVQVELGTAVIESDGIGFRTGPDVNPLNAVRVSAEQTIPVVGFKSREMSELSLSRDATVIALERDICLVVDRSGSMNFDLDTATWMYDTSRHSYNALSMSNSRYYRRFSYQWWWYWPHPTQSRWSTLVPAMYGLAEELEDTKQNELFAIASYSSAGTTGFFDHSLRSRNYQYEVSSVEAEMTSDYENAVSAIDNKYKWQQIIAGGTDIAAGITEGIGLLTGENSRPNAYKTMIVMTDGEFTPNTRNPWDAASDAADEGIEVYTVTFSAQADQFSMERTAADGNGQHFHAPDGDALEEIFRVIANIPPAAFID
ncbi:MAG: vWA domain-containing protein [Planctomycetota bacterium]